MVAKPQMKKQARPVLDDANARTLRSLIDSFSEHDVKPALVNFTRDGCESFSYRAFLREIRSLAVKLQSEGIKNGDRIILFAPNSPAWVISALAIIYSGGSVVPIDSQQSDEVLLHIIEDSAARWIFTDERGAKRLDKAMPKSDTKNTKKVTRAGSKTTKSTHCNSAAAKTKPHYRLVRLDDAHVPESWKHLGADNEPATPSHKSKAQIVSAAVPVNPGDTAVLFYTSGTTGMPKGVPLKHSNMLLQLDAIAGMDLLKPYDRLIMPLPLFHVYPLNVGLLVPLSMGLTVIMPQAITGPEIMRALKEGKATVLVAVPRLLRSLYESLAARFHKNPIVGALFEAVMFSCQLMDKWFGLRPGRGLFAPVREKFGAKFRLFTCGGALLEADLARKLRAIGWEVAVGYGLTETSPLLSIRMPDNRDLEGVGSPIAGVDVKIAQPKERDEHVDKNAGEILAKGPNVFSGYLNRPELNEEVFTSDGWFRTGDLGSLSRGNLHVIGRASSTIVMEGGEKIQPEDIEDRIAKQPGIKEIGLLQVQHKLVALVVPDLKEIGEQDAKRVVASGLKASSAGHASYLQITNFALTRDPLPRTNLGKLKRHELKERYENAQAAEKSEKRGDKRGDKKGEKDKKAASPGLNADSPDLDSSDAILIEEPAAAACLDWLKQRFPDKQISLDSSPQLDLGIDSLEWLNLTLELVEATGVELSAEAISRVSTVRELLNEIVSSAEGGESATSPLEDPDHYLDDEQREYLKPLKPWQQALSRGLYQLTLLLMKPFRVQAIGYDQLDDDTQYVFVPNHASYIDAFSIAAAAPYHRLHDTQWAGWTGIAFGNPVFAFLSRIARVFPIDAKNSLFASLAMSVSVLRAGSNLVWFPEAERTLDGKLLPFKQGIGLLLENSDVMVVPMYLSGTRQALPPGAYIPRPHAIKVIFGEPVTAQQLAKEGSGREAPEKIANALHDRVEALSKRSSKTRQNRQKV